VKEFIMSRHIRRWMAAAMAVAATGLTIGLAAASHASTTHVHTVAGIIFNALD
jgi:hypothetical protein